MGSRKIPEAPYAFPPCLHIKINSRQCSLARGAFDLREMFWFYSPHPSPPTPTPPPPTHTHKRNFCLVFNVVWVALSKVLFVNRWAWAKNSVTVPWTHAWYCCVAIALPSFPEKPSRSPRRKGENERGEIRGRKRRGKIGERKRS